MKQNVLMMMHSQIYLKRPSLSPALAHIVSDSLCATLYE